MRYAHSIACSEIVASHKCINSLEAAAGSSMAEGWKTGGLLKVQGIPAPSGQYRVGCVDLMHQLEGDDRGLLVRLYYPTEATPEAGYCYAYSIPHKNYMRGLLDMPKTIFSSIVTSVLSCLNGITAALNVMRKC